MNKITFKSLELKNFRIHTDLTIDLSKNEMMLIVGKNGSGKTSIIDGIFWCLYDETVKGQKGDSIVNIKAGKDCSAILKFDIDGIEYEIQNYRKHKTFKNTKILLRDGKQISTDMDIKSTNDIINNIVMTKDLFSNCMLFSQFVKEPFTSRTHSGQKEILDKMLSLEKYDEYYDKISDTIKETNFDEIERKIKNFIWLIDNIKSGHEDLTLQYKQFEEETLQKINTLEEKLKDLNKSLMENEYRFDEEKYNTAKKNIETINVKIISFKNQLADIDSKFESEKQNKIEFYKNKMKEKELEIKENYAIKKESLEKEINKIIKNEEKCLSDISSTRMRESELLQQLSISQQMQCGNVRDEFNSLVDEKRTETHLLSEKLNKDLNEKESNYLRVDNELSNLKNNVIRLNNELINLNENNSKNCPLCKQEIVDENHKSHIKDNIVKIKKDIKDSEDKIKELLKVIDTLKSDKEKVQNKINLLKTKYEEYENKIKDNVNKKIDTIYNSYEKSKSEKSEILKKLLEEYDSRSENMDNLTLDLKQELNQIQELITNEVRLSNTNLKLEYDSELKNYIDNNVKFKIQIQESICKTELSLEKENEKVFLYENIKNILDQIKINITDSTREYDYYKNKLKVEKEGFDKRINSDLEKINDIEKQIKETDIEKQEINERIDILNFWKKGFSDIGIKSILLDESIPILNKRARELSNLTNNIRVTFSSQSTLKSGKNNNKFSIDAVHSTNLSEYQDFSAGETRMANIIVLLCLRHLLEIMAGKTINILLLYEILDSLDDDNSEIAVDIMRSLSKEFLVMIISHSHKSWIVSDNDIRL